MNVHLIATENVEMIWPMVLPLVSKALDETTTGFEIFEKLATGEFQLWVGTSDEMQLTMVAVTAVEIQPTTKHFRLHIVAGEQLKEFYSWLDKMEAWSKEHGCTKTVASVRPGLERVLRKIGFERGRVNVSRGIA